MEEQYGDKYCVCCGEKFYGLNDDEPVNQICKRCSNKFLHSIKPRITLKRHIAEFIFFILINLLVFNVYLSEFKKFSFKAIDENNLLTLANSVVLILGPIIIFLFFIFIKNKKK